jgi:CRP-like cAMP-binding protein
LGRQEELADTLASFTLFSDLNTPQLRALVETFDEATFQPDDKVLRQGLSGSSFYIILEGEAAVRVDGVDRTTVGRGDFFGEVSILLGETPVADIVALSQLRCLVLPADQVKGFLTQYPSVMYRMLQTQARRIRQATQWRN